MKTTMVTWGDGATYYVAEVKGGWRLYFDAAARRPAAYGHVYATEAEARDAAYAFASP